MALVVWILLEALHSKPEGRITGRFNPGTPPNRNVVWASCPQACILP